MKMMDAVALGQRMGELVVKIHNVIAIAEGQNPEALDPEIEKTSIDYLHQFRDIIAEGSDLGALNTMLNVALEHVEHHRGELRLLSDEQMAGLEFSSWTPDDGELPEPFDLTLGVGAQQIRFISLASGQWKSIPVDTSAEMIAQWRKEAFDELGGENWNEKTSEEDKIDNAVQHARLFLLSMLADNLGRFSMDTSGLKSPGWALGQTAPVPSEKVELLSHELVGIVVTGDINVRNFENMQFKKLVANYCGAQEKGVSIHGILTLENARSAATSPQSIRDLSLTIAQRIAKQQSPADKFDLLLQARLQAIGIERLEETKDLGENRILLLSIVREPTTEDKIFGVPGNQTYEDMETEQRGWISNVSQWMKNMRLDSVYIMPPAPYNDAIARLGAAHCTTINALNPDENMKTIVAFGHDGEIDPDEPLDVVGFNGNNRPIGRTQLPAWLLAFMPIAMERELEHFFMMDFTILAHDPSLDMDSIPSLINTDHTEDANSLPTHIQPKRTLH